LSGYFPLLEKGVIVTVLRVPTLRRYASRLHLRASPLAGLQNCMTLRPGHDWAAVMAEPSTLLIVSLGLNDDTSPIATQQENTPVSLPHVDSRSSGPSDAQNAGGRCEGEASQEQCNQINAARAEEDRCMASRRAHGPAFEQGSAELRPRMPVSACECGIACCTVKAGEEVKADKSLEAVGRRRGMRILQTVELPHLCALTWLPDGRGLVAACRGVAHLYQARPSLAGGPFLGRVSG
jgi:hypothetical protein